MCLAIPGQVVERFDLEGLPMGRVEFGGVTKDICLAYVPQAKPGDFVVVHVGFAISIVDAEEAARTRALLDTMRELAE